MTRDHEQPELTPERRHELADSLGHLRVAASSLLDNADLTDSVNLDHVRTLDHNRTDAAHEATMAATVYTAQAADMQRNIAHCLCLIADDLASGNGINHKR